MPLVSVIVPIYNDEEYLADCLASIERQTLRDIEVLCIDDGSTDSSLSICEEFACQDGRFRVVPLERNQGVSHARNIALERATGDYIAFMDADDWYPDELCLEKLYDAARGHDARIAAGSLQRYNQKTDEVFEVLESERALLAGLTFESEGILRFDEWQYDYGFYRFLYERKLLEDNGIVFPPLTRHEDPVFLVKALLAASEFYAIPDVVYSLRMGYKSVQLSPEAVDDALEGVFQIVGLCDQNGLTVLRDRQKIVLRQYFIDTQGVLEEFYLKDLIQESANRIGAKIRGAVTRGGKDEKR